MDAPDINHNQHPYFRHWTEYKKTLCDDPKYRCVPIFRSMIQQYKIDKHRGVPSSVSEAQFALASSIRRVALLERRRRVISTLKQFGLMKVKPDRRGLYNCQQRGRDFSVYDDFGGRLAQLRYAVSFPEFKETHPMRQLCFESAHGFGLGHWDFIVEENVDEVFQLFRELIAYCTELPDRIRGAVL